LNNEEAAMPQPLSFDHLQAILRQHTAALPDFRKPSPNTRYTVQGAALGAFGIFFMQSPSFLEYQRQLKQRQGHDNAQTLFGIAPIPCDNQVRQLLDPIAPRYFNPVFFEVFAHLEQEHLLDPFRVLDQQLLVALDGTQYFSSKALHCHHCLTRQLSNGQTLYYHTAITPVVVCPGHSQVIALAPEYIMPQDGHEKQDCEQAAGKRWLTHQADTLVPPHVTLLGDDLYSKQPFCALALQQGFNFILVCKPDSHPKLYERLAFWQAQEAIAQWEQRQRQGRVTEVARYRFINDVLLQDGQQALSVNWVEITLANAKTGEQLYYNTFITNHRLSPENVAQVAQAGRGRWKIENENNNVLKTKGYHLEHNFGHGKQYLSATMLSLNLLAFLFHTVLEWRDEPYAVLRQVLARRQTFFEDMRALTRYIVFDSWHHLMGFMIKGLQLESKLESERALRLTPKLDTS
jgi:hypothetical protein